MDFTKIKKKPKSKSMAASSLEADLIGTEKKALFTYSEVILFFVCCTYLFIVMKFFIIKDA